MILFYLFQKNLFFGGNRRVRTYLSPESATLEEDPFDVVDHQNIYQEDGGKKTSRPCAAEEMIQSASFCRETENGRLDSSVVFGKKVT